MFEFLKKLAFWKKKKAAEEQPTINKGQAVEQEPQPAVLKEIPLKSIEQPKPQQDPVKEEKLCPKCGAPNDKFVHTCWLCKTDI